MKSKKHFFLFFAISAVLSATLFFFIHFRVTPNLNLEKVILFNKSGKSTTASALERTNGFVLHFFASWCPDCRREMPIFLEASKYIEQKGFSVYIITDENLMDIENYTNTLNLNSVQLLQLDRAFKKINVNVIPASFVFNAANEELYSKLGRVNWDNHEWLDKVLK